MHDVYRVILASFRVGMVAVSDLRFGALQCLAGGTSLVTCCGLREGDPFDGFL